MSIKKSAVLFGVALSMAAFMSACSSDTKEGGSSADVDKVSESKCAVCHGSSVSTVTGDNIYQDYIKSAHNLVPNASAHYPDGVGCQGCHGGGAMHNGVGPMPYPDPDAAGKCFECHKNYLPASHFVAYTTNRGTRPAMYASNNFQSDCTACHDPHKADANGGIGPEHKDWAESRHGDVNGAAWANRDFKNSLACIRCHTSTGLINYVESGYTEPTTTWAQPGDFTREVATCKTCHTSYAYGDRVRPAGQYTAPYTNAPTLYPDAAASNLCLACHTGRVSGDSIKADTDADGVRGFLNSHYLTAGGIVFAKSGFHFYSSASKLGLRDYAVTSGDDHQKIGISGSIFSRTFNEASSHTNGPCVGCHLTSGDGTHTFSPFTQGLTAGNVALNPMCANSCHTGRAPGGANENSANTWFGKDVTAADLVAGVSHATHKGRLIGAYEALKAQLELRGIYFGEAHPYFYTAPYVAGGTNTAFTNWQSVATALDTTSVASDGLWKSVMGTAFNYNLLVHDPGAVAHNRRYARRLVYDSIDFLDDGIMNRSVNATLTALPDTTAYKTSALAYVGSRP